MPISFARRRQILKISATAGVAATSGLIPSTSGNAASGSGKSGEDDGFPTAPFVDPLPLAPIKQPLTEQLSPPPTKFAGVNEFQRGVHQAWDDYPPITFFKMHVREFQHKFHRDLPWDTVWGYDGMLPGPTFAFRYRHVSEGGVELGTKAANPCVVRIYNDLPSPSIHTGFGNPEIICHIHNSHTPAESDGYPLDFYHPDSFHPQHRGHYLDHHIPNIRSYRANDRAHPSVLGTIWYHDHCEGYTAANVYKGLAGFWILFDEIDSGDENDPNPEALRLPSGLNRYDIPLVFQDKTIDSSGYLVFDQLNTEGKPGNKFLVNGKIQPYFNVERRKYRFRMLNGSTLRIYDLFLAHKGKDQTFTRIASDGNLFLNPLRTAQDVLFGPAERADIVIDFSQYNPGDQLYIMNRFDMKDGRGQTRKLLDPGIPIMRFDVIGDPLQEDNSRIPDILRRQPTIQQLDLSRVVRTRRFKFDRRNGLWTINNEGFSDKPVAIIRRGDDEIWEFETSGGWAHPIHVHMEEGRMLSRNGKLPPPYERFRKDVFMLFDGDKIRMLINFDDFFGRYVMHCHNSVHEDHHMMATIEVVT